MIQPEVIRKGSKVYLADTVNEPVTVSDVVNGEITLLLKTDIKTSPEDLYPVPLTPENIVRCGFFKTDARVFEHPVERIELEIDHKGVTHMYVHNHKVTVPLSAVHELQHAFWTYTSKELSYQ